MAVPRTQSKTKEPTILSFSSFRIYLQSEFIRRCKVNPRYSLRAFAGFLKIDHSSLSQFLRGRRNLSEEAQRKLAMKLQFTPIEIAHFWGDSSQETAIERKHDLTADTFQVIADWYHYAIFELITVKGFQSDPKWIAKRLGVSTQEAHAALERLKRLELIELTESGKWKQGSSLITTAGNPFTAIAFRKLQKQVLEMGIQALEEIPFELRDQTSMTMAIHSSRIPAARERIKKFRRELCKFLQSDEERDSVYQLGVSLYPLTRIERKLNQ